MRGSIRTKVPGKVYELRVALGKDPVSGRYRQKSVTVRGPGPTPNGRCAGSWTTWRRARTSKLMAGPGRSGSCSTTGSPSRSPPIARQPPSPATEG